MGTVQKWLAQAMAMGRRDLTRADRVGHGNMELSPKQRVAVRRGTEVVERYGGVLLADAVGLGKTRVAVAMARRVVRRARRRGVTGGPVYFAVPARVQDNWRRAIGNAGWQIGRDATLISHHQLSRQRPRATPVCVVVDEAHRCRNPEAKRSRHLALLTRRSPLILVTATPVCTGRFDLYYLLRYFLRDADVKALVGTGLREAFEAHEAGEIDIVEVLQNTVIRRDIADFSSAGRPSSKFEIRNYRASDDEAWLWKNLESQLRALHCEATGSHWPPGLMINFLLRRWESAPEALRQSLAELIHFHERWLQADRAGRRLQRADFQELFDGVDRQQEVFSFLYEPAASSIGNERRQARVIQDLERLNDLHHRINTICGQGAGMIDAIAGLVGRDREHRYLIFTRFHAAAQAIFDHLCGRENGSLRVGLITGDRARATGLGRCHDREVLRRFLAEPDQIGHHQAIRLLVVTDCLSEGVNLQQCTRLVLADLPYSPVRLEQRIGRIARPGSRVDQVTVYLMRPHSWSDSLGLRRRLRSRLELARQFGAGHGLAESIATGPDQSSESSSRDPQSEGPLAAMTEESRLWHRVCSLGDRGDIPRMAQIADCEGARCGLWVRVRIEALLTRHVWVWIPAGDDQPVVRLSEQLPGLARLADDERRITAWQPGGPAWDAVQAWMNRRQACLEAARLAPPLIGAAGETPVRLRAVAALTDAPRPM